MNGLSDYFSAKAEEITMKFNYNGIVLQTFNDTGEDSGEYHAHSPNKRRVVQPLLSVLYRVERPSAQYV